VLAIRVAKAGGKPRSLSVAAPPKPQVRLIDKDRPLEAFTTERAQRSGRANAASGRILVTIPADWFGPIPASHCPEPPHAGERGIELGDTWADRLDCRQYGAHFPHVAGIAGQSHCGAQSVVLSVREKRERGGEVFFIFVFFFFWRSSSKKAIKNSLFLSFFLFFPIIPTQPNLTHL